MKTWRALRADSLSDPPFRIELHAGVLPDVPGGCAILIAACDEHLEAWTATLPSGSVLFAGHKHPKRGLSDYLMVRSKHVFLRSTYRDEKQFEHHLPSFFSNSLHRKRSGVLYLGLPIDMFAPLYTRAPDPQGRHQTPLESRGDDLLAALRAQLKPIRVSADLAGKYRGDSFRVQWVREQIMLASMCTHPVLIEGETGTGKEIVAQQIRAQSDRRGKSFQAVNCAAIPENLLESELFGHVKGAFSGATSDKDGLWKIANGGTLFLDEVGEMSLLHQAKVLRAMEDGRFRPVGGVKDVESDARIIAATNRDLLEQVREKRFREDLYHRLNTIHIRTPALRDHPEDVPDLALHIWDKLHDHPRGPGTPPRRTGSPLLPPEVLVELSRTTWPGNVRGLRAFLQNLAMFSNGDPPTLSLVRALMNVRQSGRL